MVFCGGRTVGKILVNVGGKQGKQIKSKRKEQSPKEYLENLNKIILGAGNKVVLTLKSYTAEELYKPTNTSPSPYKVDGVAGVDDVDGATTATLGAYRTKMPLPRDDGEVNLDNVEVNQTTPGEIYEGCGRTLVNQEGDEDEPNSHPSKRISRGGESRQSI